MHENTVHKWKVVDQGDRFGIGEVLRHNAGIPVDLYVRDGDTVTVGSLGIAFLHTPGHTDNHLAVLAGNCLFTGDLLLIGQAGRSDLPGGDTGEQYDTLFGKILRLPDETRIYPGHDYEGRAYSTLAQEKQSNPFLLPRTREEYRLFVEEFFPPFAESTGEGGAMTLQCGTRRVAQPADATIPSIGAKELAELLRSGTPPLLLDVREPVELMMTGAVEGSVNIPLKELPERLGELPADPAAGVACICASGSRSFEAAHYLKIKGRTRVYDVEGGVGGWARAGYHLVRPAMTTH
jgi:rhodanese-related sulfurtransferase